MASPASPASDVSHTESVSCEFSAQRAHVEFFAADGARLKLGDTLVIILSSDQTGCIVDATLWASRENEHMRHRLRIARAASALTQFSTDAQSDETRRAISVHAAAARLSWPQSPPLRSQPASVGPMPTPASGSAKPNLPTFPDATLLMTKQVPADWQPLTQPPERMPPTAVADSVLAETVRAQAAATEQQQFDAAAAESVADERDRQERADAMLDSESLALQMEADEQRHTASQALKDMLGLAPPAGTSSPPTSKKPPRDPNEWAALPPAPKPSAAAPHALNASAPRPVPTRSTRAPQSASMVRTRQAAAIAAKVGKSSSAPRRSARKAAQPDPNAQPT